MLKQFCITVLVVVGLSSLSSVHAEPSTSAKVLFYIHPQEYSSYVKLRQFYSDDYWYVQGPMVELAAKEVFGKQFGDTHVCDSNQLTSNTLVWLRPRIFYNPMVTTFYATITAVAYGASGKPIGSYEGQGTQVGYVNIHPEKNLKEVYIKAMQQLADKMKLDTKVQDNLNRVYADSDAKTPCALASLLPAPKVQFMAF